MAIEQESLDPTLILWVSLGCGGALLLVIGGAILYCFFARRRRESAVLDTEIEIPSYGTLKPSKQPVHHQRTPKHPRSKKKRYSSSSSETSSEELILEPKSKSRLKKSLARQTERLAKVVSRSKQHQVREVPQPDDEELVTLDEDISRESHQPKRKNTRKTEVQEPPSPPQAQQTDSQKTKPFEAEPLTPKEVASNLRDNSVRDEPQVFTPKPTPERTQQQSPSLESSPNTAPKQGSRVLNSPFFKNQDSHQIPSPADSHRQSPRTSNPLFNTYRAPTAPPHNQPSTPPTHKEPLNPTKPEEPTPIVAHLTIKHPQREKRNISHSPHSDGASPRRPDQPSPSKLDTSSHRQSDASPNASPRRPPVPPKRSSQPQVPRPTRRAHSSSYSSDNEYSSASESHDTSNSESDSGAPLPPPRSVSAIQKKIVLIVPDSPEEGGPPTDLPPEFEGATENHRWDHRYFVAKEIFETERTFFAGLMALDSIFSKPLLANGVIPTESIQIMFPPVLQNIIKISAGLLEALEAEMQGKDGETICFGHHFSAMISFLKLYSPYINNYDAAINLIAKLKKTNPTFLKFVTEAESMLSQGTLESLLITVIQRIPRYVLLISDLLKKTPSQHPDFEPLSQARDKVKVVADFINEERRKFDLAVYSKKLHKDFGLKFVESRVLWWEETVYKEPETKRSRKQWKLVLFSDIVILSKSPPKKKEIKKFNLIQPITIYPDAPNMAFSFSSTMFYCESKKKRKKFLKACEKLSIPINYV